VKDKVFEILFAFDEIIAPGSGIREDITLNQVRVNLEMESHEEKLANMIKAAKMQEAKVSLACLYFTTHPRPFSAAGKRQTRRISTAREAAGGGKTASSGPW
jgi:hypothetical protein